MKPEEWQRVKELCGEALQHPPGERAQFLATACANENERREVDTLLAAYESQFLEEPVIGNVAEIIVNLPGNQLAPEPVSHWQTMRRRLRFVLVGLFFAFCTVSVSVNTYFELTSPMFFNPDDYGFGVMQQTGSLVVARITPSAPADTLQTGDEFVSVDGKNIRYQTDLINAVRNHQPDSSYPIVVRRNGQLLHLPLRMDAPSFWYYVRRVIYSLVSITFLVMGLLVFLLKPDDKAALLLGLWFGAIGNVFPAELYMLLPVWLMWVVVASGIWRGLLSPLCLHFFLVFPELSPLLRRFPRLESYLYVPYLLVLLPYGAIYSVYSATSPDRAVAFNQGFRVLPYLLLGLAYFAGGIVSLVVGYRRASLPSRRKVRVMLAGTIAGFLPPFIWLAVTIPTGPYRFSRWMSWGAPVVMAAMLLVPPAYAYAILRHRVIPVSLIIRRGVQYLFAKNVLRLLIALPIFGLIVTILANPDRTLSDILFRNSLYFYVILMIAAAIIFLFHKRLNNWIDRKFFREQYNQEQILSGLIEEVKRFDSVPEMSRVVSRKVESALHPERIYLFYRGEECRELSLGYSSEGASQGLRIPEEFRILRVLEGQVGAQDFPFLQKNILPGVEEEWLTALGTRLIVPLVGTDHRLAGLFLLGDKKSEVPYTANDRNLLESLAGQVALVYENAQLKEWVDRERKIKHEVLGRFEEQHINLLKECPRCGTCFDSAALTCDKDGSELTLSMPVERTIEGRYRLERLVGSGGMGAVYEARDLRLNRPVAIKILSAKMFGNREALRRFEREARTSARLSHRNIIAVYDYGVLSTGGAYLVMELISGETLAALIKREGCVAPQTAADCFNQLLEAIKAAHAAGVIHRDLKPANVLISKDENGQPHVRILDFGLAKISLSDLGDTNNPTVVMTTPGTVMGTIGYMSPEQLTGETVDERSDLFSVGVMVVEALTGRRPFRGSIYTELLNSILHGSFHLETESKEAERLDAVLQKCLAKDREGRFSSAGEMQTELILAIREYPLRSTQQWSSSEAHTRLY